MFASEVVNTYDIRLYHSSVDNNDWHNIENNFHSNILSFQHNLSSMIFNNIKKLKHKC